MGVRFRVSLRVVWITLFTVGATLAIANMLSGWIDDAFAWNGVLIEVFGWYGGTIGSVFARLVGWLPLQISTWLGDWFVAGLCTYSCSMVVYGDIGRIVSDFPTSTTDERRRRTYWRQQWLRFGPFGWFMFIFWPLMPLVHVYMSLETRFGIEAQLTRETDREHHPPVDWFLVWSGTVIFLVLGTFLINLALTES